MRRTFYSFWIFFLYIQSGQFRELWSDDLPHVSGIVLEEGRPVNLQDNLNQVQISGLNGTLYSESLSQLSDLKELRIYQNQLRDIENGALCSSQNLKILELEFYGNKKPPALTKDSFNNCDSLEELILKFDIGNTENPSVISDDAFEKLTNLKKFAIQGYIINHLKKDFFKLNRNSLSSLVLSFANLQKIDSNVLSDFKNLEGIFIVHNSELTILPEDFLSGLPNLKTIVLRDNALTNLTWDEFKNLPSLKKLVLVDNQISYFNANKIATNMPYLEQLEIEINPGSCKDKEIFVKELKKKLDQPIEVSYKFEFGVSDSCE